MPRTLPLLRRWSAAIAALTVSFTLGIYVQRSGMLPSPAAQTPAAHMDSYQFFDTLVDVRAQILQHYVEPVDDHKLLLGAVDGMLGQLDPYSNYFTRDELAAFDKQTRGQFAGVGAEITQDASTGAFIIVSPLEGSPALKAGILAGDRILEIDGVSTDGQSLKDILQKVSGVPGSKLTLRVLHEGEKQPVNITMTRGVINLHSVKGWKIDSDGNWNFLIDPRHRIAYVRITTFMDSTPEDLDKALQPLMSSPQGLNGIVLDLRFDPGGLLSAGIQVADRFLDSGLIVSTRGRDGETNYQAEAHAEGTYPPVPLVVLVNEYSASAAEIVSGALQDHHRAVLIGNRTFGKGSVQKLISLNNGDAALKLTTAYYYLPSGRNIARKKGATTWGVDPDPTFLMPLTRAENRQVLLARQDSEIIRPVHTTTLPAGGATTAPATQAAAAGKDAPFVDKQLQRGLEVLIAHETFARDGSAAVTSTRPSASASLPTAVPAAPLTTQPASKPATWSAPVPPARAADTQPK